MENEVKFLTQAIALAEEKSKSGQHGPFGAVVVKNDQVIAEGWNQVVATCDPSAHAEVIAIRKAASVEGSPHLSDCVLYTSCEPCPMCLATALWARIERIVYAETREGAAKAGFNDALIYRVIQNPEKQQVITLKHYPIKQASQVFQQWINNSQKQPY